MASIGVLISSVFYKEREVGLPNIYRESYMQMAKFARDMGLGFFMSTFQDLNRHHLKRALVLRGDSWRLVKNQRIDVLWDRHVMDRTGMVKNLRHSAARRMRIVNRPELTEISDDKFRLFNMFPDIIPRSFLVHNKKELKKILPRIRTKRKVFKPVDGYGGNEILIQENPPKEIVKNTLVQEFIECKRIPKWGAIRPWDIRITIISGRIDNVYIRIAKEGSFLSNVHKGGRMKFMENSDIPASIKKVVKMIDLELRKFRHRIYTADFMLDKRGRAWLIEINSRPGIFYPNRERQKRFYTHILAMLKKASSQD